MSYVQRLTAALRARADSWLNSVTGVGVTTTGRGAFQFSAGARLDDQTLEDLYHGDPYASRIVRVVPEEALRRAFTVSTGDASVDSALTAALDDLSARLRMLEAWTWGRLFGGGAVLVGADDGRDPALPLDVANLRSVRFLVAVDKRELTPATWYTDRLKPTYGEAETYRLTRSGQTTNDTRVVHASRLVIFPGVLTTRRRRQQNQGWDDSELQRVYDALRQFNATYAAAADIMQDASQGVFKIKGLPELFAQDARGDLATRLQLLDLYRSVSKSILVDADGESFERVDNGAVSGLDKPLDKFLLLLAGASEIPVTILMGQAPAGLNATGESDIRLFFDRVASAQQNTLRPRLEHLVRLLLLSKDGPTGGQEPASWEIKFPPLWQPTAKEESEIRKTTADADKLYLDSGVLTPAEVRESRFRREGWSMDTSLQPAALAVPASPQGGAPPPGSAPPAAPTTDEAGAPQRPAVTPDQLEAARAVVAQVAAREISRATGLSTLAALGLPAETAAQVLGDTGESHFTAPAPEHAAEVQRLRDELAALGATHRGTKGLLERLTARIKAGESVTGATLFGQRKPEDDEELRAKMAQMAAATADSRAFHRDAGHTGVCVVLPVPEALRAQLAAEGGEPAEDLHVTLAYLGSATDLGDDLVQRAADVVADWADGTASLPGVIAGHGCFVAPPGEPDPVWVHPDCPGLSYAREALRSQLVSRGLPVSQAHGFTPHITLAYVPKGAAHPAPPAMPLPVTFDRVALWVGDDRSREFPLGPAPAPTT